MSYRLPAMMLCLLLSLAGAAQNRQGQTLADSMVQRLRLLQEDTSKAALLYTIAYTLSDINPELGLSYAAQSLKLAEKLNWKAGQAHAHNEYGNCYLHNEKYPKALEHYFSALRLAEQIEDEKFLGTVYGNIGTVYFSQRDFERALSYYRDGLQKARSAGDAHGEINADGNIGTVFYEQKRYPEALDYMRRALTIAERIGFKRGSINQLINIGNIYAEMDSSAIALGFYFHALERSVQAGNRRMVAVNQGNIGETYLDMNRSKRYPATVASRYLDSAIDYLRQGIATARKESYNTATIDFLGSLAEAYTLKPDNAAALATYRQYIALKDSVSSLESAEKIARIETNRAMELKDRDIRIAQLALLKKRNERWVFLAGIGILLSGTVILYRNFRRQRLSNLLLSREKKRSDDLLLNILPEEVAEELKDHGKTLAKQYEEVSVLFTDFVDFTGTAEQLSPSELVKELHECFSAFDTIIEKAGLEKIKTIGDAYMAVCGLPLADAQHAQRAVQAAIDIRDFIAARLASGRHVAFQIRIGIHSGPVVAGIVGVKKFAYDIWGDTVNTAARMEQHGVPGKINISESTYLLVKDTFSCEYRGRVEAKHKGEIAMYFVNA